MEPLYSVYMMANLRDSMLLHMYMYGNSMDY